MRSLRSPPPPPLPSATAIDAAASGGSRQRRRARINKRIIRINDRPVFYKHWSSHGISKIAHLQAENGTLLRYDELRTSFQQLKWLEFYGVLSSVKSFLRKLHSTPMRVKETVKGVTLTELISKKRKVNNFIYTSLSKKRTPPPIRSQEKSLRDLCGQNECDVNWKVAYTIAFNCTLSTKLRTFHFKLLHRGIATNDFLTKISLVQSDKCCFCEHDTETITHLFLRCSITQSFWNDVKQFLFQKDLGNDFFLTDLMSLLMQRLIWFFYLQDIIFTLLN